MANTKWEYKIINQYTIKEEEFNTLGQLGWEVCGTAPTRGSDHWLTTLKRPIMDSVLSSISQETKERLLLDFCDKLNREDITNIEISDFQHPVKRYLYNNCD